MIVTQEWTHKLPMMQQTVLLECTRGPDNVPKYDPSKFLLRWYRRCVLVSAFDGIILTNPYDKRGGSFTGPSIWLENTEEECTKLLKENPGNMWAALTQLVDTYLKGVDAMPHHFHLHLMHAIQILGFKHPNSLTQLWWRDVYYRFVHDMHLFPENRDQLDRRLGDSREGWLERADKATIA